jgi:hypothetical protein
MRILYEIKQCLLHSILHITGKVWRNKVLKLQGQGSYITLATLNSMCKTHTIIHNNMPQTSRLKWCTRNHVSKHDKVTVIQSRHKFITYIRPRGTVPSIHKITIISCMSADLSKKF